MNKVKIIRISLSFILTLLFPTFSIAAEESSKSQIKINFGPTQSQSVDGYFADSGEIFSKKENGLSYGWEINSKKYAGSRCYKTRSAEDSFVKIKNENRWKIELPDGFYRIKLSIGKNFIDRVNSTQVLINGKEYKFNGIGKHYNKLKKSGLIKALKVTSKIFKRRSLRHRFDYNLVIEDKLYVSQFTNNSIVIERGDHYTGLNFVTIEKVESVITNTFDVLDDTFIETRYRGKKVNGNERYISLKKGRRDVKIGVFEFMLKDLKDIENAQMKLYYAGNHIIPQNCQKPFHKRPRTITLSLYAIENFDFDENTLSWSSSDLASLKRWKTLKLHPNAEFITDIDIEVRNDGYYGFDIKDYLTDKQPQKVTFLVVCKKCKHGTYKFFSKDMGINPPMIEVDTLEQPVDFEGFLTHNEFGTTIIRVPDENDNYRDYLAESPYQDLSALTDINVKIHGYFDPLYYADYGVQNKIQIKSIEVIPPEIPSIEAYKWNNNGFPTWSWNIPMGTTLSRYRINNGNWVETDFSSYSPDSKLEDGKYIFYLQCKNRISEWSESTSHELIVDLESPTISNLEYLIPNSNEDSFFSWKSSDNHTSAEDIHYEFRIDKGNWTASNERTFYPGFNATIGQHIFEIRARDLADNLSDIYLLDLNKAPVAESQSVVINEDETRHIILKADDINLDNLNYYIVTNPDHGSLGYQGTDLVYTPDLNYFGTDSFSFKASDGLKDSNTAIVSVSIKPVNDAPVASNLISELDEDTDKQIVLQATDVENNILTYQVVKPPLHGTLTGIPPRLVYHPTKNFNGVDQLLYVVSDGTADSNIAEVKFTVKPVNDVPVAHEQTLSTNEDTEAAIALIGTDIDSDILSYVIKTLPLHGTLSGEGQNLHYLPNSNFYGSDSFEFSVFDGKLESQTAQVNLSILPVNDAPVANALDLQTRKNEEVNFEITADDIEGDDLKYNIVEFPSHGYLQGTYPDFTYMPGEGYSGVDFFTFQSFDYEKGSNIAKVTISVFDPKAELSSNFSNPTNILNLEFTVGGRDIIEYRYSYDENSYSNAFPVTQKISLNSVSEGEHSLKVIGKNSQGFWQDEAEASEIIWLSDYTSPETDIDHNGGIYNSSFSISVSTSEESSIFYTTDNSQPTPGTDGTLVANSTLTLPIFKTTTLKYFAKDRAGNIGNLKTEEYLLDTVKPEITMDSPTLGSTLYSKRPEIVFDLDDDSGIKPESVVLLIDDQNQTQHADISNSSILITPSYDLPDGVITCSVSVEDQAGNVSEKYFRFKIDTTPLITESSHSEGSYGKPFYLTLSSNRPGTIYYTLDGSTPIKGQANTLVAQSPLRNLLINGSTVVKYYSEDIYGNTEDVKTISFVYDPTPPNIMSTSIQENEIINSSKPHIVISYEDDSSGIDHSKTKFHLNGYDKVSSASISESQLDYTPLFNLANDINFYKIVVYDFAGNSTELIRNFKVDTVNPQTTTSLSPGKFNTHQDITFSANEQATIFYTIDGSDPVPGSQGTYSGESPISNISIVNSTLIKYFSVDLAGNQENVKSAEYIIDTEAPPAPSGLTGSFKDSRVELSWNSISDSDIKGYNLYRKIGNSAFTKVNQQTITGNSPLIGFQDNSPPQGDIDYTVTAVDNIDNESGFSNTVSGTCLNSGPDITITNYNHGFYINQPTIKIMGTASDASLIDHVKVNGQTAVTTDGFQNWEYEILLSEGANTLNITSADEFGNQSQLQISGYLDSITPQTTASHSSGIYNTALEVVLISSEPDATVFYTLDGSLPGEQNENAISGTGQLTITELHATSKIRYSSVDKAGNQEPTKTLDFILALKSPTITDIKPQKDSILTDTSRPTISAKFTSFEVGLIQAETAVTLNGKDITQECAISQNGFEFVPQTDLTDGQYNLDIKIKDQAGNISQHFTKFSLDSLVPQTNINMSGGWYSEAVPVTLTLNKPGKIYYSLDGNEPAPGNPNTKSAERFISLLISSDTTLSYFGIDQSGRNEEMQSHSYYFDFSAPEIVSIDPANGSLIDQNKPNIRIVYRESETELLLTECSAILDGHNLSITNSTESELLYAVPFDLQDGEHHLAVLLKNQSGKTTERNVTFQVDSVLPETTINQYGDWYSQAQLIVITLNKPGTIHYTTDGTDPVPDEGSTISAENQLDLSISENTTLKYFGMDLSGRKEAVQTQIFQFDFTAPTITSVNPDSSKKISNPLPPISVIFEENQSELNVPDCSVVIDEQELLLAAQTEDSLTFNPITPLDDGSHNLTVTLVDNAGNKSSKELVFYLNTIGPVTTISPTPGSYSANPESLNARPDGIKIHFNINSQTSVQTYYTTDGSTPSKSDPKTILYNQESFVVDRNTTINYYSIDSYGNQEVVKTAEYIFEWNPPAVNASLTFDDGISTISWASIDERITEYAIYRLTLPEGWHRDDIIKLTQDWVVSAGQNNIINFGNRPDPSSDSEAADNLIASIAGTDTTFQDKTIQPGIEYIYYVQAIGANGERGEIVPKSWRKTYVSNKAPITSVSHLGGYYNQSLNLEMGTNTPTTIYYTIDGTEPSIGSQSAMSPISFLLDSDLTIKYFSIRNDLREVTRTQEYVFDFEKPEIESFIPTDGVSINNPNLAVEIQFQDDKTGIDYSTSRFYVDGKKIDSAWTESGLTYQKEWLQGNHEISVVLYDKAGNKTTGKHSFTLDSMEPTVILSSPSESRINNKKPRIVFETADVSPLDYSTMTFKLNNEDLSQFITVEDNKIVFIPQTELPEGNNSISFCISDVLKNKAEFESVLQIAALPQLERVSPTEDLLTEKRPNIEISFNQNAQIKNESIKLKINETDVTSKLVIENGRISFTPDTDLWEGYNQVQLELEDDLSYKWNLAYNFKIDSTKPETSVYPETRISNEPFEVSLMANENATIYYTLDGSNPTPGSPSTIQANTIAYNIKIQNDTIIKHYAVDIAGNNEESQITSLMIDTEPPEVLSGYPSDDLLVGTSDGQLEVIYTFGDDKTNITVRLFDENGRDITHLAIIDGNTIKLLLDDPKDGHHQYTLIITDEAGNTTTQEITFFVDASTPVTVASIKGGELAIPISVDLTSSEAATIYYSTDGYPPYEGSSNTSSAESPIKNIPIEGTTKLQFFAVDRAGNTEKTKYESYVFEGQPDPTYIYEVLFNEPNSLVEVSWSPASDEVQGYYVYRCNNIIDKKILDESRFDNTVPPKRLRLDGNLVLFPQYDDTSLIPGSTYWYGVSVVHSNGLESAVSKLISVQITSPHAPQNKTEAVARAETWLESKQFGNGSWGTDEKIKLLATSQVLNTLKLSGKDNAGIRKGLFYLRGHYADNNDYLSRKIKTLHRYDQNIDLFINRLVSQSYIKNSVIYGWGLHKKYQYDAFDTALGNSALKCSSLGTGLSNYSEFFLRKSSLLRSEDGHYGWISGRETSIYVSAFVHNIIKSKEEDYQWILDNQNQDGSFGNGLIDTSAVLLWLDFNEEVMKKAEQYLISQQLPNGSWKEDLYLTGICLEALLTP